MRKVPNGAVSIVVLALLAGTAKAASPAMSDPCEASSAAQAPEPTHVLLRRGMHRDVAVYIAKHLQRACRRIEELGRVGPEHERAGELAKRFREIGAALRADVLEPIDRLHPELRGQDLTERSVAAVEGSDRDDGKPGPRPRRHGITVHPGQLSRSNALQLQKAFSKANDSIQSAVIGLDKSLSQDKSKEVIEVILDVMAEVNFAAAPIYSRFADLSREEHKLALARIPQRGPEVDEALRKLAPPPGSVQLSPAAAKAMRSVLDSVNRESKPTKHVLVVMWVEGARSKGPNDTAWTTQKTGVMIGAHDRMKIPSDVVRTIDGLPIMFQGDDAARFAGKTLDYKDKHFVIVDR